MDDKHFVKAFLAANRPGIYCRVLGEGPVQAGDRLPTCRSGRAHSDH